MKNFFKNKYLCTSVNKYLWKLIILNLKSPVMGINRTKNYVGKITKSKINELRNYKTTCKNTSENLNNLRKMKTAFCLN